MAHPRRAARPSCRRDALAVLSLLLPAFVTLTLAPLPAAHAATLTVQNTNDSFAGSLRQQVLDSAAGDTIVFAPATWGNAITLTGGQIVVSHDLVILGPQHDLLVLRGTDSSRLFELDGGHLTIGGLALADAFVDGMGQGGGLIRLGASGAALTVVDSYLADGRGVGGGLILAPFESPIELVRCTLNDGVSSGSDGGAIATLGPLTATDCLFFGNQAAGFGPCADQLLLSNLDSAGTDVS